jgi:peptide/nickel transport system substrate-binding protein
MVIAGLRVLLVIPATEDPPGGRHDSFYRPQIASNYRGEEKNMEIAKRFTVVSIVLGLLLAVLMLISGAQSCSAAEQKPRYGGTLTISDMVEETNIGYPPKMMRPPALRQGAPALETLLRTDPAGKLTPWLATAVKEDPKAMTITLTLRKGVKFHDGTDFNAEAVKWNLEQNITEKSSGTDKIKSVDVVNDSTVRINLIAWDSTFISNLAQPTGLMISPAAFKKNGADWCSNNPIGTGPFQIVSRQQGVRTSFKKFDGYWQKGKPYLDKIEFTFIQDPLTREMSLKKGDLDLMVTYAAKNLKTLEKEGLVVKRRRQPAGARCLVFDSANPKSPFADVRVRQAAQYAVDINAINMAIFYGEHEPTYQQVYKGNWAYNPSVVGYPYNPAKAKQLLAAAGYPHGFKTKITYYTTPENDQLYSAIQNYLKVVGIDAELDPSQIGRWNQLASGGKWEGMLVGLNANIDVLAMINQMYTGTGKFTQMLTPPDYLKTIKSAIEAKDFKSKQKYTQEVARLMTDKYSLFLTLYVASEFGAQQPYLHDHGFLGSANTALWTPENAWRDK